MYSRPSASHTRDPAAWVMRVGTSSPAAPNSASGRLLPVDVNPGTRQSLTVFHHLDGHRAHELRLALVERCPVDHFAHRAHNPFGLPRLEELDHPQRRFDVREQTLEVARGRGWTLAPGGFEGPALIPPGHGELVQHQHDGMGEVERGIRRVRGYRDHAVA